MMSTVKRSAIAFGAMALGMGAIGSFSPGCSQCAAGCTGGLVFWGNIDVNVAEQVGLTITACYETDCTVAEVVYDEMGQASCTKFDSCGITDNGNGTARLSIRKAMYDEIEEGAQAKILVQRTDDGSTILDEQIKVKGVGESEVCGDTCYGATVSW